MYQLLHNLFHQPKLGFSFALSVVCFLIQCKDLGIILLRGTLEGVLPLLEHSTYLQDISVGLFKFHLHFGEEKCTLFFNSADLSFEE